MARFKSRTRTARHPLRRDLRFRHLDNRLLRLGRRSSGELLFEIARDHGVSEGEILARLEAYAALDPGVVARLDACDWPPPPLLEVA